MNAWAIVFLALGAVLVWWGYKSGAVGDAALLAGAYLAIKEVAAVPGILGGGGGGGSSGGTDTPAPETPPIPDVAPVA